MELAREYRAVLENILLSRGARQIAAQLREITEPGRLADVAGYSPDLTLAQKVEVLETIDVETRLRLVLGWARDTLADLTLRDRIKNDVEEGMEKTQREFLLRRQLDAIKKELGQLGDGDDVDPDDYRAKIADRDLPDHVRTAILREIDKLERTNDQSPETGWIRTWLDTILEVPWGVESEDRLDIHEAQRILDADHDGLEDVKDRILEHLAVTETAGRARADARRRTRLGRHPRARRSPGRRQDLARSVDRERTRTQVRARSRSVACATRRRSAGTVAPTSAPSPDAWCARCERPAR